MLSAHAAVAMENARLHERSRELSLVEERNRLARELHDSLVQKLFGVVLAAESASTLIRRAGAAGYLLKDVEPKELVRAIRTAHTGEALLHPAVAARLMEEFSADDEHATWDGLTARILAKLGVTDRTQATLYAVRHGLLQPGPRS